MDDDVCKLYTTLPLFKIYRRRIFSKCSYVTESRVMAGEVRVRSVCVSLLRERYRR